MILTWLLGLLFICADGTDGNDVKPQVIQTEFTKWEYKQVANAGQLQLNELGDQGWELTAVIASRTPTGADIMIFKRRKPSIDVEIGSQPELGLMTIRGDREAVEKVTKLIDEIKKRLDASDLKAVTSKREQTRPEGSTASSEDASPTTLAEQVIGTWVLTAARSPGTPGAIGTRLKMHTPTHWVVTEPDPDTGEVLIHLGGRYSLDGNIVNGTTDFAVPRLKSMIGQNGKTKFEYDGKTLKQTDIEGNWLETWTRWKPTETLPASK